MKDTILVTGSEGNIGRYLVRDLHRIYPLAKIIRVAYQPLARHMLSDTIAYGDLRDRQFVSDLMARYEPDYVVHLAARLYGVAGFNSDVYGLYANDIQCLLNTLDACRKIKKFVYFSSSMVYESSALTPFSEDITDYIRPPKSSYGLTKFTGENAVKFHHAQYGTPYTIWRPFNVVSPLEPHTGTGGHVFVDMYRKIFVNMQDVIDIYGNGMQTRCFTWVEDVTDGIAQALVDHRTMNEVFNIGSNDPRTMIELEKMLVAIGHEIGHLPKTYAPRLSVGEQFYGIDVQQRIPDLTKINRVLGWTPRTTFYECFRRFVEFKLRNDTL